MVQKSKKTISTGKTFPIEYSSEELEAIREQIRIANDAAREVAIKRGYKLDPRCKDLK